jgi:hypothetical protein
LTLSETAAPAMGEAGELLSMTRPVRVNPDAKEIKPAMPQIRKTPRYFIKLVLLGYKFIIANYMKIK